MTQTAQQGLKQFYVLAGIWAAVIFDLTFVWVFLHPSQGWLYAVVGPLLGILYVLPGAYRRFLAIQTHTGSNV